MGAFDLLASPWVFRPSTLCLYHSGTETFILSSVFPTRPSGQKGRDSVLNYFLNFLVEGWHTVHS